MRDSGGLLATELAVLEIDIVNDLGDGAQRGVVHTGPCEEHFERAHVALVRHLALEHVEAQLARLRLVILSRDELEARLGIDEASYQPRTGDTIDMDAATRDPRLASEVFR